MFLVFFLAASCLSFEFWLWPLGPGITLLCQPESAVLSFWDGTGFYIHRQGDKILYSFRQSHNIREISAWSFPVSFCFIFHGLFHTNLWSWNRFFQHDLTMIHCTNPIPSQLCRGRGSNYQRILFGCFKNSSVPTRKKLAN